MSEKTYEVLLRVAVDDDDPCFEHEQDVHEWVVDTFEDADAYVDVVRVRAVA